MTIQEILAKRQEKAEFATPPGMQLVGWLSCRDDKVYEHTLIDPSARPVYAYTDSTDELRCSNCAGLIGTTHGFGCVGDSTERYVQREDCVDAHVTERWERVHEGQFDRTCCQGKGCTVIEYEREKCHDYPVVGCCAKPESVRPQRSILFQSRTDPTGAWSEPTKIEMNDGYSNIYPILVLTEEEAVHSVAPDYVILTYNEDSPGGWISYRYSVAPPVCPTCEREL